MDCYRALGRTPKVAELWTDLRRGSASAEIIAEARIVGAGSGSPTPAMLGERSRYWRAAGRPRRCATRQSGTFASGTPWRISTNVQETCRGLVNCSSGSLWRTATPTTWSPGSSPWGAVGGPRVPGPARQAGSPRPSAKRTSGWTPDRCWRSARPGSRRTHRRIAGRRGPRSALAKSWRSFRGSWRGARWHRLERVAARQGHHSVTRGCLIEAVRRNRRGSGIVSFSITGGPRQGVERPLQLAPQEMASAAALSGG